MSDRPDAAAKGAACSRFPEPRAARLAKFRREQLIVAYLNRGVSVAEIAAHIGVGEKRTRAVIREILARRMPHPPEEFVAIQVSRLNEAMLIAFSAMSPSNLKAVDRVVKIVRELDRYGGAFAAEWARPQAPRLDAPDDGDAAFVAAWLYGPVAGRPTERGDAVNDRVDNAPVDDRPEIPAQSPEKVDSAPGFPASPVAALAERGDAVGDRVYKPAARADRPANPTQSSEMVQSPPGNPVAALHSPSRDGRPHERPTERGDAVNDRVDKAAASSARPENPAQIPEKVESAPGIGLSSQTAEASPADRVSTPDLILSLLRSAAGRRDLRFGLSGLRAGAHGVAPRHGGADTPFAAPAAAVRPENPAESLENMESTPGRRDSADAPAVIPWGRLPLGVSPAA